MTKGEIAPAAARSGDFSRRVLQRRHELGLGRDEVARRAEMHPDYLDYLEHAPQVALGPGALQRLAGALETTVDYLSGAEIDRPPGPGRAGPRPHLDVMSREECEAHLAGGGVGRFVFTSAQGPVALPVNFRLLDGDVVFRTRTAGLLAIAVAGDSRVGFEVDHIDEPMSEGWSVLISGRARLVNDRDEVARIERLAVEPWPGGPRETIVRIETETIAGRRIRQMSSR